MSGVDGNVSNLNRDVFSALKSIKDPQHITADEAQTLQKAILKDGHIDSAESDLLQELTQDKFQSIKVSAQKSADFHPDDLSLAPVNGAMKQDLQTLRTHPEELNRLWAGGSDGLGEMVKLYSTSPQAKNMIMNFIGQKFQDAWKNSDVMNGYGPLRDLIGQSFNTLKSSDPETARNGRQMLFDAAQALDRYLGGSVPDFLYNWLKPNP
jgi:hypothetical protein